LNSSHRRTRPEQQIERAFAKKWMESCHDAHPVCSLDSFGDLTATTVSASASVDDAIGESYLRHTGSDCETDSEDYVDDVDIDEPRGSRNDKMDDDAEGKLEEEVKEEGDDVFHAMILLGTRVVNGETFWTLQNSWSGMRLIEMSTNYLAESGGVIVFFGKHGRQVRAQPSPLIQFCPSPIAESGPLDRADCEYWDESLTMGDDACLEIGM